MDDGWKILWVMDPIRNEARQARGFLRIPTKSKRDEDRIAETALGNLKRRSFVLFADWSRHLIRTRFTRMMAGCAPQQKKLDVAVSSVNNLIHDITILARNKQQVRSSKDESLEILCEWETMATRQQ